MKINFKNCLTQEKERGAILIIILTLMTSQLMTDAGRVLMRVAMKKLSKRKKK